MFAIVRYPYEKNLSDKILDHKFQSENFEGFLKCVAVLLTLVTEFDKHHQDQGFP